MIDTTFDMRSDSNGLDPDSHSPTLKKYHQLLWSKKLPNGKELILDDYLVNTTDACSYSFSSDSIIHSYSKWKRYQHIISQIPKKEIEEFIAIGSTIGGYIIFPKDRIDGLNTINQERGTNNYICDRFDLTLECIRLFYLNQNSPLYDCLLRYKDFFDLFVDFKGYVEFFLLNDIVDDTFSKIDFFYRDESFKESPLPTSKEEYFDYRNKVIKFVNKRNKRIQIIR